MVKFVLCKQTEAGEGREERWCGVEVWRRVGEETVGAAGVGWCAWLRLFCAAGCVGFEEGGQSCFLDLK